MLKGGCAWLDATHQALGDGAGLHAGRRRQRFLHQTAAHPHAKATTEQLAEQIDVVLAEPIPERCQRLVLLFAVQCRQLRQAALHPLMQRLINGLPLASWKGEGHRFGAVAHLGMAVVKQPWRQAAELLGHLP